MEMHKPAHPGEVFLWKGTPRVGEAGGETGAMSRMREHRQDPGGSAGARRGSTRSGF